MRRQILFLTSLTILFASQNLRAQQSVIDLINETGTFEHWSVRRVHESGIIGGNVRDLYEFYGSPTDTLVTTEALIKPEDYLWRTNNVMANVLGVIKTSTTVFPEKRGDGYCARIEVLLASVKALSFDINVVSTGAFFIGNIHEPIRDTKNPMLKVQYGVPFTEKPKALIFDYKCDVGHQLQKRKKPIEGVDVAEAAIILQKRWEDEDGTTHAIRIGTGVVRFTESVEDWVNGYRVEIKYGDISADPDFKDYEDLKQDPDWAYSTLNSKGKPVTLIEEGWGSADDEPNVLFVKFFAGCAEPYTGGVGNKLWIDNVKIEM